MMSRYLLLFTILVSSTQALNVEFAYNSRGGPDLYLGDTLTLTCTSIGGAGITLIGFELSQQSAVCVWNGRNGEWVLSTGISFFSFADFSAGCNCLRVPTADSYFTYSVSGTITEDFRTYIGSALYCYSFENGITTNSSTSLVIGDLKVPPENLALTISPDPVVEGEPFSLICNSSSPISVYKYETSRYVGLTWSEITGSPPTYTPTSADREGLLVRCTDTAHVTWTGGNTVQQTIVLPNYLETLMPSLQVLELNPTVDNSLTCDVSSRPEPVYSWTRSNGSETLKSVKTVTLLSYETRCGGEVEVVVCAATVSGKSLSSTVIWQIIWSVPRPTLTIPTPTVTCQNSCQAAVVVAGVEGAVLIIIAIGALIWWWRKRKVGDAKQNAGVQLEPRLPATIRDYSTPGAESNYTSLAPRRDTEEHNYQQLDVAGNSERLYCNVPLSSDRSG